MSQQDTTAKSVYRHPVLEFTQVPARPGLPEHLRQVWHGSFTVPFEEVRSFDRDYPALSKPVYAVHCRISLEEGYQGRDYYQLTTEVNHAKGGRRYRNFPTLAEAVQAAQAWARRRFILWPIEGGK